VQDLGLLIEEIVQLLEVRNVQGAHSPDGRTERVVGRARPTLLPDVLSRGPQDTQDPRPIKPLPFTMLAEAHVVPPLF
jgi:hypothetical protein